VSERILYQFTLSPFSIKVRKVLEYKHLAYRTIDVNPFSRAEVVRLSGQPKVPVLVEEHGNGPRTVVADSTAIAVHLDAVCPDPPVYPRDPAERARVALLEDWSDEGFARILIPFKILTGRNARRMVEQSKRFYAHRPVYELLFPFGPAYLRRIGRRLSGGRTLAQLRIEYERALDTLDALASRGAFLAGEAPTVFDFAVYGALCTMEGLEGHELLATRANLARWYASVGAL